MAASKARTKPSLELTEKHSSSVAVMLSRVEASSRKTYPITPAVIEQRRNAATRHGLRSEYKLRATAKNQKRTLLRKLGVRASDLDAVSAVYVDVMARGLSKVQLLDTYYAEHGIVREDGQGEPTLSVYLSALNVVRLTAARLSEHLVQQGGFPTESLESYIEGNYGNGDGDA